MARVLGETIAAIRGVQQTHSYFVMEEVKSTHRIGIPESGPPAPGAGAPRR